MAQRRSRYSYAIEETDTRHRFVSASDFRMLSHHWTADAEDADGITRYYVEADGIRIECGRRIRRA